MSQDIEEEIRTGDPEGIDNSSSEEGDDVMADSSDEDEDDDDEEAIKQVRDGFIVDDEEDQYVKSHGKRRKHMHKREKSSHEDADDVLDEDDLELLRENSGAAPRKPSSSKFKRIHRAQQGEDMESNDDAEKAPTKSAPGLNDFFSDEDGENYLKEDTGTNELDNDGERNILDEFEDFIEDDNFSDEEEARAFKKAQRQQAKRKGPKLDTSKLSSIDRESLQQLFEVFGNGAEYEWALEAQEIEDEGNDEEKETALEEVFEYSELKEKMLTQEDNLIRIIDIPERFQKYRSSLNYANLEGEELLRKKKWISNIMYLEKRNTFVGQLQGPFSEAVEKVVELISVDNFEVPFIWAHRRDYLIFTEESRLTEGISRSVVHKLLLEDDLWRILRLDIEYHSLYEKRLNTERLVKLIEVDDDFTTEVESLESMVSLQDLQDYVSFTYSAKLKATKSSKVSENHDAGNEDQERATSVKHSKYTIFEKIRENVLYDAVKAYGITATEFGENVRDQSSKNYEVPYRIHATDDPLESPQDMIERLIEDDEVMFKDFKSALNTVRKTYAEEIFHNPKIRQEVRQVYKNFASISVILTDKGRSSIDDLCAYADFKYAMNRSPADLVAQPGAFLRMLEAEQKGFIKVNVLTNDSGSWFRSIFNCLKSDGTSEIADMWNKEREIALQMAFKRLTAMVALNTKEDFRRECERLIAAELRVRFLAKVDQAPFTPFGYDKGTRPNVLALSFGKGDFDSAVVGAFVRDTGKISDFFKSDLNPARDHESKDRFSGQLQEFFERSLRLHKPDVVVVSGANPSSKQLFEIVKNFIANKNFTVATEDIPEGEAPPLIPVIWGQDETARLYQNSTRAMLELAEKPTLVKYCVGLARYVQSPLLEYISLRDDIFSLVFYDQQKLLSKDTIQEVYETVFVDIVNMVGVEINEALREPYVAQMLPYVAGLGHRKASGLLRNIAISPGTLPSRSALITYELTTRTIFLNCAAFLNIPYDDGLSASERDASVDLLDATRIHPEDYTLACKMAADALDLDEEDVAHLEDQGGIIYQLMQEGVSKVDDLNLTAFGQELESKFGQKKYATLQSIKEELVNNYEELRRSFHILENSEVFRMLTGETTESFLRGSIVPVTINRVGKSYRDQKIRFLRVSTSTNIHGSVEEGHILRNAEFMEGQVIQTVVLDVNYESFMASFSALPEEIQRASRSKVFHDPTKWNLALEDADKQLERAKENANIAKTRNVQHPLFHNFNHKQAEEFLAPQSVGDCVIRPSSRGPNYLTVTWKVANNLFQHLSIEEVPKPTGKEYVVERKRYSDLDQLIFQHVQAIAKHVNEMCRHPKFREGALTEVNEWLESYTRANRKNSAYVFCYDHKAPGWFLLLFKVNVNTPVTTWHVKTEVNGFVLKGFSYPNMMRLCNGFKQTFKSLVSDQSRSSRYY